MFSRTANPLVDTPSLTLHDTMVLDTIKLQMTTDQQHVWLPLMLNYQILCTYAQTELGHGMPALVLCVCTILSL